MAKLSNYGSLKHDYYVHYQGGSWRKNDMKSQAEWLKQNEELWSKQ